MSSRKNQWTQEQQELLFKLQGEYGNRWSVLATKISSKDDSSIKNKFYSTLRKGLRKINKYIVEIKKKKDPVRLKGYKTLQEIFITKLIAVVDNNFDEKYEVKQKALDLSSDIQRRVIQIACNDKQYLKQQFTDYRMQEDLLKDIQQFNKNCKKRKGKRKSMESSDSQSENEVLEIIEPLKQPKLEKIKQPSINEQPRDSHKTIESKESLTQKSFLLPHTKQNIILSAQPISETQGQGKLKIYFNNPTSEKKEENKDSQRKESSNPLSNSFNFVAKTEESQMGTQQNNLQSSSSMNMTGSWFFQSMNSRDMSKKISGYITHASPLLSDYSTPYTFGNYIKNSNITGSSLLDSKNQSTDLSSSKFFQTKQEQKTLSLLDQLPVFIPNSLVRSADLQQSTEMPGLRQTSSSNNLQQGLNGGIANMFRMAQNFYYNPADNIAHQYSFADESSLKNDECKGNLNNLTEIGIEAQLDRTKK